MSQTEINLYGDIGSDWWTGDGITENYVLEGLKTLDRAAEEHVVRINSVGGQVGVGLAIMNLLLAHSNQMKVFNPDFSLKTINDGYAMSIASVIFMAGDKRVMALGSIGMIHEAWNGCYGNAAEMRKMADTLDLMSGNIADVYANRCVPEKDRTAAYYRDLMKAETYMTGQEMVEKGLATDLDLGLNAATNAMLTPEKIRGQGGYVYTMTAGYKKRTYSPPTAAKSVTDAKAAQQRIRSMLATFS